MTQSLLIIGAGPNQVPAIKMARARGLRVVATDMNPQAEGFALVDRHGVASTRDAEGTIAFARQVHQEMGLDGVMTMASESAITVARVAEALGLPGLDPEAALRASHKVVRQRCFREHGVPSPRFGSARSVEEGVERAREMGWPVVVKPADSAGARGVRKVKGPEEMAAAVEEIRGYSKEPEYLLEEFLTGTEHSIEGIVIDGKPYWTGFSDRNYDKKEIYPPFFLEDGDTLPTILSPAMLDRVYEASNRAVEALGIDWGPAKGDILIAEDGPRVLEMASRLSGDYFCYETVPLHNGVDLLSAVMNLSLGMEVDPPILRPKFNRGVALRYVWPRPGRVREIRGIEEVRAMPGVHFFNWEPRWRGIGPGTEITAARSMGERVGCVMTCAGTRDEAVRLAETAVGMVEIITE